VRLLGVVSVSAALVLGVAGNAMARTIADFSAKAECDARGKGVISITEVDPLGVGVEVTVFLENNGADERLVGTRTIENSTAESVTVAFPENWKPNAEYRIRVRAEGYLDQDIEPNLTTPSEACKKHADEPPAAKPPKSSAKPLTPVGSGQGKGTGSGKSVGSGTDTGNGADQGTDTGNGADEGSGTPSESESTSPAPAGNNNVPPPERESNLAETGATSNTPVIAGIATAFLAVGFGSIYFGTRRHGASSR
jgi:hypothetical protein